MPFKNLKQFLLALSALFCALLFTQCSKDSLSVAFEMTYPQNRFTVPAGLNTLESHYIFFRDVSTSKNLFFDDIPEEQIQEITPARASLRADQNVADFAFAEEIIVRLCEDSQVDINNVLQKCRRELFFRDNIPFNTGRQVDLIPNAINLKEVLTGTDYTFVVVFRNRAFTSINIPANLEMVFEAKR